MMLPNPLLNVLNVLVCLLIGVGWFVLLAATIRWVFRRYNVPWLQKQLQRWASERGCKILRQDRPIPTNVTQRFIGLLAPADSPWIAACGGSCEVPTRQEHYFTSVSLVDSKGRVQSGLVFASGLCFGCFGPWLFALRFRWDPQEEPSSSRKASDDAPVLDANPLWDPIVDR